MTAANEQMHKHVSQRQHGRHRQYSVVVDWHQRVKSWSVERLTEGAEEAMMGRRDGFHRGSEASVSRQSWRETELCDARNIEYRIELQVGFVMIDGPG